MATTKALVLATLLDSNVVGGYALENKSTYLTTSTSAETVDTFAMSVHSTVTYMIQATHDLYIHIIELTVSHNTIDAFIVRHNEMMSEMSLITNVTATVNGTNINIGIASTNALTKITVIRKAIQSSIEQLPFGDMSTGIGTYDLATESGTEDLNT